METSCAVYIEVYMVIKYSMLWQPIVYGVYLQQRQTSTYCKTVYINIKIYTFIMLYKRVCKTVYKRNDKLRDIFEI